MLCGCWEKEALLVLNFFYCDCYGRVDLEAMVGRAFYGTKLLLVLGFLGSPRQKSRGNPQKEISRQILFSLCSSTSQAAQRKGKGGPLNRLRGWLCLAAFIRWDKARLQEKVGFLKKAGLQNFPFQGQVPSFSSCVAW